MEIIGGSEVEMVHNHHNFAWEEEHFGRDLVVVRKGATPAFPGQKGFVGGSMGDDAVILEGARGHGPESETGSLQAGALYSTVHGAGRVMSRTAALGKRHRRTGRVLKRGKVSEEMMGEWVRRKGVVLRGGGVDESPHGVPQAPRRAGRAERDGDSAAHAAAACGCDGGGAAVAGCAALCAPRGTLGSSATSGASSGDASAVARQMADHGGLSGTGRGWGADGARIYDVSQCHTIPSTCSKCRSAETRSAPVSMAWAAIQMSLVGIGRPLARSDAAILE